MGENDSFEDVFGLLVLLAFLETLRSRGGAGHEALHPPEGQCVVLLNLFYLPLVFVLTEQFLMELVHQPIEVIHHRVIVLHQGVLLLDLELVKLEEGRDQSYHFLLLRLVPDELLLQVNLGNYVLLEVRKGRPQSVHHILEDGDAQHCDAFLPQLELVFV